MYHNKKHIEIYQNNTNILRNIYNIYVIKRGGRRPSAAAAHFLDTGYGPSVACTGCTWLMYSLCMAHIWPMYDLHMAHIAFRSAIRSAQDTDHQGTLANKSLVCC